MKGDRGLRRAWAAAIAAVALVLVMAAPASAHPYLVSSNPQAGVVAPSPPNSITIAFTEALTLKGCSITLRDQRGHVVRTNPLRSANGGAGMSVSMKTLPEGIYTVNWVAYGNDGHTVAGSYEFGVPSANGQPPPGAGKLLSSTGSNGSESAPIESGVSIAGRWLAAIGAFLLLGGALLLYRLRGRIDPELQSTAARRWRALALVALFLALAGTLAEALERANGGSGGFSLALLTDSPTGVAILVRLGLLVLCAAVLRFVSARWRPVALGAGGAAALGALAIDGHVATVHSVPELAAFGQIVHLVSAGVWVGGVLVLAICLVPAALAASRPAVLMDAARAFTPLAAGAAVLTCGTGIVAAVREARNFYFLRWSTYGNLVIAGVVVVAIMLIFGATTTWLARRSASGDREAESTGGHRARWLLRGEATFALAAAAVMAVLGGTLQARGQPLPSQRGNLLPGAGFADVAPQGKLADMTLAPARPGVNRIVVAFAPPQTAQGSTTPTPPSSVSVALSCACGGTRPIGIKVPLHPGAAGPSAWYAVVGIPRTGVWNAQLRVNGAQTIGSPTFTVGIDHAPGSAPVTVASVADLSGPDAIYCRSQELGALYSIELMNIVGGVGGRKIDQELMDDGGNPAVARADALQLARQHPVAFLAPCGQGADAAIRAVGNTIPTIVADSNVPVTPGRRVFRMAPNPYSEGYAAGQYFGKVGLAAVPTGTPKVINAFVGSTPDAQQRVSGLRAGLAVYGIQLHTLSPDNPGLAARLRSVLPSTKSLGIYLDAPPGPLSTALREIGPGTVNTINPTAILISSRMASENFVELSGDLGREGQVRALDDVDPTSNGAQAYVELAPQVVGELPTLPGLSGFVAGQALAYGLIGGTSADTIASRLVAPAVFSKAATSPWSDRQPATGTLIFGVYLPVFLTSNLIPAPSAASQGAPGEVETGQFFSDGDWESTGGLFTSLPVNLGGGTKLPKSSYLHPRGSAPARRAAISPPGGQATTPGVVIPGGRATTPIPVTPGSSSTQGGAK